MTMRTLMTTTALAIGLAMPVAAQTDTQGNQTQQTQGQQQQAQGMQIMVSSLIGRTLYMLDGQMQGGQQGQQGDSAMSGDAAGDDGMTAEEQQEVAEGGVEGEAEELEQGAEDVASDVGQAVENTAEDVGQAASAAWNNLEAEVTDAPENWQRVGEIDDVIVTQQGEVRALLVDAGGFLGAGATEQRIDIQNVRFVADSDDEGEYFVVFAGDRSTFEGTQTYDQAQAEQAGEMRATENPQFQEEVYAQGRGLPRDEMESASWEGMTTEDLLGTRVYGQNDEWVGDLSELRISQDGNIEGVIIDVGGFLGIGEKPVLMPLDQVELRRDEGAFGNNFRAYVNATEEELDAMEEWVEPVQ
ncbi:PRC-barrel domain-containing protein [Roseicyclus sp.]|uniref:PRC-barrel domain-containing protein n=1 Tax=Roseicyclus sp. TaxID=1914329 RepID=UPI003FA14BAE